MEQNQLYAKNGTEVINIGIAEKGMGYVIFQDIKKVDTAINQSAVSIFKEKADYTVRHYYP
ncbi:MAG: hypothetical protein WBB23_01005 [Desulforhopalus sp.]